jgi:putative ABC transport system permease protein
MYGRREGSEPPARARSLVRWAAGPADADVAEGELLEAWRQQLARVGVKRAGRWYWRQAAGFVLRSGAARRLASKRPEKRGGLVSWLSEVSGDVRWAVRGMRKRPAFTAVAVATLALGIGSNSAIFTLASAHFLAPLPYADPDRVVLLWETDRGSMDVMTVAPGNYFAWKENTRSFADIAAFNVSTATLSGAGFAERVRSSVVTPNFFSVLGVVPEVGTFFTEQTARAAAGDVVILSHSLWVRRFGADPGIVGRDIRIAGRPHRVLAVMPSSFRQPERDLSWQRPELWRPLMIEDEHDDFGARYLRAVARLRPGISVGEARQEMSIVASRMARAQPESNEGRSILVKTLDEYLLTAARPVLVMLLVAGLAVLLIVCANVANLTLARGQERRQEFAVRAALGSGRARLLRQVIVEGILLSMTGAVVGVIAVFGGRGFLEMLQQRYFSGLIDVAIDVRVIAFTALVALAGGILFALPLARIASRSELRGALIEGGQRAGASRRVGSTRNLLIVGQVALAMTLLAIAALLTRSFDRLVNVPPGFGTASRITFDLAPPSATYPDRAAYQRYYREILAEVAAVPGVSEVTMSSDLPFTTENVWTTIGTGDQPFDERTAPRVEFHVVSPDWFALMGIAVLDGTLPPTSLEIRTDTVAIVSRQMARLLASDGRVVGTTFSLQSGSYVSRIRIVAVVADVLDDGYDAAPEPTFYMPWSVWPQRSMTLVVRTQPGARDIAAGLRTAVANVDPDIPAAELRSMDDLLAETVARPRAASLLGGLFALIAVLVAATGIYGVLSYAVQSRTREIGIRAALGASGGELVSMILFESGRVLAFGLVLGLPGALVAGTALSGLLFGIGARDPVSLAGAAVVLGGVGLLAAWLPARRAVRVDPHEALRTD